jgi:hypothetical protein
MLAKFGDQKSGYNKSSINFYFKSSINLFNSLIITHSSLMSSLPTQSPRGLLFVANPRVPINPNIETYSCRGRLQFPISTVQFINTPMGNRPANDIIISLRSTPEIDRQIQLLEENVYRQTGIGPGSGFTPILKEYPDRPSLWRVKINQHSKVYSLSGDRNNAIQTSQREIKPGDKVLVVVRPAPWSINSRCGVSLRVDSLLIVERRPQREEFSFLCEDLSTLRRGPPETESDRNSDRDSEYPSCHPSAPSNDSNDSKEVTSCSDRLDSADKVYIVGDTCSVCMEEDLRSLLLPCAHMCMCHPCATKIHKSTAKCPICRAVITSVVKL